jgi:hypothetical protein
LSSRGTYSKIVLKYFYDISETTFFSFSFSFVLLHDTVVLVKFLSL